MNTPLSHANLPATLPSAITVAASPVVGRVERIESLGGMSGARVVRLAGPAGSLVAKAGVTVRERAVYEQMAPVLAAHGIRIPLRYATVVADSDVWLLIEDIPRPLPRERWLADGEVMATLHRLHALPRSALDGLPDRFEPAWSRAMNTAALGWLGPDATLPARLTRLCHEAEPLFRPVSVISGDPNPLNWGLSGSGELVLMDWERIGLGHPALDVAITVPGLPSRADFETAATAYNAGMSLRAQHGQVTGRLLALAKVWAVVELLASTPGPSTSVVPGSAAARRRDTAAAIAALIPDWLARVTERLAGGRTAVP